jgi:hypothetical protein
VIVPRIDPKELCPCGSGKQTRRCCLRAARPLEGLPLVAYPEQFAVGAPLAESSEFAEFYRIERPKITDEIAWVENTDLPSGVDHRTTTVVGGQRMIQMRRMPADSSDAYAVAHELGHLVMEDEGFPGLAAQRGAEHVAAALNSALHDPVVDQGLRSYGFDPRPKYFLEVSDAKAALERHSRPPDDAAGKLQWLFNYLSKLLDWDAVRTDSDPRREAFQSWFERRFPQFRSQSQELYSIVREVGFDTPERMQRLFESIVRRYNLEGSLRIGTVRSLTADAAKSGQERAEAV